MNEEALRTASLHRLVERIQQGDNQAEDELVRRVVGRLERLTRKMLHSFPGVRSWEQTADVLQNALMRLLHTLKKLRPQDTRSFFCLATEHVRRELIDLNRHYLGAHGLGRNLVVRDFSGPDDSGIVGAHPTDHGPGIEEFERWQAFHEAVGRLSAEHREVFGLIFYHGWTQLQVAALLQIHERTVRRLWNGACMHLNDALGGELPVS